MSQITIEAIQAKQTELAAMIQQLQSRPVTKTVIEIESCDIELAPGEHYAGAVLDINGEHQHHLILMDARPTGKLYTAEQLAAARVQMANEIMELPQIKGNLFAERAIRALIGCAT